MVFYIFVLIMIFFKVHFLIWLIDFKLRFPPLYTYIQSRQFKVKVKSWLKNTIKFLKIIY